MPVSSVSQAVRRWLSPARFLAIILLGLGIFFRFVDLDQKVYSFDEAYTSLRISGYTEREVVRQVCDIREVNSIDLQKYQRPAPQKTLKDSIKSLAVEDPQHSPLYYLMARFWVKWFGTSVTSIRSLSAIISLLVFPCIYWLSRELFQSSLTGWVAVALIAVSPFHVLYAQEAREYSLWTVTILLSSASLLRAIRLKTRISWVIYALTVVLGLYTFLFSVLVSIGHGIYIAVCEKFRLTQTVKAYLIASFTGILAFAPWLQVIIINFNQLLVETGWTGFVKLSPINFFIEWSNRVQIIFYDGNIDRYITPAIVILVLYSLYFLYRSAKHWLFVFSLIAVTELVLILPDLILGGTRSLTARYLIPYYLGIELAIAHLLANQISLTRAGIWHRKFWQLVTIVLISGGILSCLLDSRSQTSWTKSFNLYTPQVAHIINQANSPLLISSCEHLWPLGDVLSLSYLLEPKVRIQLVSDPNVPKIPIGFSDVFLFFPSPVLLYEIEANLGYKVEAIHPDKLELWRLVK